MRPVPRWLHGWAILTVAATALLLVLGGFVTTFRVGMADPVWPTEPWYLASNYKLDFGYLIEHVHRILGWTVGLLGLVLTFGLWTTEPRSGFRAFGLAVVIGLILDFGTFQWLLIRAAKGEEGGAVYASLAALVTLLLVTFGIAYRSARGGGVSGQVRALALLGMCAAMTQGLLGGVRVRFNDLAGRELSAAHGTFAQIVFALLVAVAVLTAKPRGGPEIPWAAARKLRWQTAALVAFTFLQIVWGAWVRHFPSSVSARLHLLFAFVVVGLATLAIKQALSDPDTRERLKLPARVLMALIAVQVLFGVEAWMGKFFTGTLPEFETITAGKAFIRTAHAHVGTWVLGVSVILALVARRRPAPAVGPEPPAPVDWQDAELRQVVGARSAS